MDINVILNGVILIYISLFSYYIFSKFSANGENAETESIDSLVEIAINNGIVKFMEANTEDFQNYFESILTNALNNNPVTQVLGSSIGNLSEEDLKNVEGATKNAYTNILSESNPIIPVIAKYMYGDNWQQEIANSPQQFMLIFAGLQKMGIMQTLESFMGGLNNPLQLGNMQGQPTQQKQNNSSIW